MNFIDDMPVELDCGCIAYAPDRYYEISIPDVKDGKIKYDKRTYCGDDECLFKAIDGYLKMATIQLETGEDKKYAYGDILHDRMKDDGF